MRVLVVEDEQLLADTVAEGLRRLSMAVDVCYDGEAALLTAWYGGFFLLAGVVLVVLNYVLVSTQLPDTAAFVVPLEGVISVSSVEGDVMQQLEDYQSSTLNTLLVQSGIALLVTTLLAGVVGWVLASRVLEPLQAITATANRLEAEDLNRRINLDGPDDELKELADTFDGMLDRLATAFDSQRRFVANASHELRTPLAIQRTLIEVALDNPAMTREMRTLGTHLLATNERSERLIDGLLLLARSDRGLVRRDLVRFDEIVDNVVAPEMFDRPVNVVTRYQPCHVRGDPVLLEQLVWNLVRNALVHSPTGADVYVEVRGNGEPALLIANTGEKLPADAVAGLFEPFRRMPGTTSPGAGLGLSIVRSIAVAHQGGVTANAIPDGGFVVEVNLPALSRRHGPVTTTW